jgi:hypothetical protein
MPDLLEQGAKWLSQLRTTNTSRAVAYCRAGQTVSLNATLGANHHDIENDSGAMERVAGQDFIVPAASLDFGSGPFLPEQGDRISFTEGILTRVFEVLPPAPNKDCWTRSGPLTIAIRIHTKEVAAS